MVGEVARQWRFVVFFLAVIIVSALPRPIHAAPIDVRVCAVCCTIKTAHIVHAFDAAVSLPAPSSSNSTSDVRFSLGFFGGYHHGAYLTSLLSDVRANGNSASTLGRYDSGGCDVFVGPGSSNFAKSMSTVLPDGALWIDFATTSTELSDSVHFPVFSRVVPSLAVTAQTTARVMLQFGWTAVHILGGTDSFSADAIRAFSRTTAQQGIHVESTVRVASGTTSAQLQTVLDTLTSTDVRVVYVAMAAREEWQQLRTLLSNTTLGYSSRLIILVTGPTCSFGSRSKWDTIPGALCVVYGAAATQYEPFYADLRGRNWTDDLAFFNGNRGYAAAGRTITTSSLTTTDRFAPYAADAVAFVMHGIRTYLASSSSNATQWSDLNQLALLNHIRTRTILTDGFSGPVSLDNRGDRPASGLEILNSYPPGVLPNGALSKVVGTAHVETSASEENQTTQRVPVLRVEEVYWSVTRRIGLPIPSGRVVGPGAPDSKSDTTSIFISISVAVLVLAGATAVVALLLFRRRTGSVTHNPTIANAPMDTDQPFTAAFITMRNAVHLQERYPLETRRALEHFRGIVLRAAVRHKCHYVGAPVDSTALHRSTVPSPVSTIDFSRSPADDDNMDAHVMVVAAASQDVFRCVVAAMDALERAAWKDMFQRHTGGGSSAKTNVSALRSLIRPAHRAHSLCNSKPSTPVLVNASTSTTERLVSTPLAAPAQLPFRPSFSSETGSLRAAVPLGKKKHSSAEFAAKPTFSAGVAWGRGAVSVADSLAVDGPRRPPQYGGLVVAHAAVLADMAASGQLLTPSHVAAEAAGGSHGCYGHVSVALLASTSSSSTSSTEDSMQTGTFRSVGWARLVLPLVLRQCLGPTASTDSDWVSHQGGADHHSRSPQLSSTASDDKARRIAKQLLPIQEVVEYAPLQKRFEVAPPMPPWAVEPPQDARAEYHSRPVLQSSPSLEASKSHPSTEPSAHQSTTTSPSDLPPLVNPLLDVSLSPSPGVLSTCDATDAVTRAVARASSGIVTRRVAIVSIAASVLEWDPLPLDCDHAVSADHLNALRRHTSAVNAAFKAVAKIAKAHLATIECYVGGVFTLGVGVAREVARVSERAGSLAIAAVHALQCECECDDVWASIVCRTVVVHALGDECVSTPLGGLSARGLDLLDLARSLRLRCVVLSTIELMAGAAGLFSLRALDIITLGSSPKPQVLISVHRLLSQPRAAGLPWYSPVDRTPRSSTSRTSQVENPLPSDDDVGVEPGGILDDDSTEQLQDRPVRSPDPFLRGPQSWSEEVATASEDDVTPPRTILSNLAMAAVFDCCTSKADPSNWALARPFESPPLIALYSQAAREAQQTTTPGADARLEPVHRPNECRVQEHGEFPDDQPQRAPCSADEPSSLVGKEVAVSDKAAVVTVPTAVEIMFALDHHRCAWLTDHVDPEVSRGEQRADTSLVALLQASPHRVCCGADVTPHLIAFLAAVGVCRQRANSPQAPTSPQNETWDSGFGDPQPDAAPAAPTAGPVMSPSDAIGLYAAARTVYIRMCVGPSLSGVLGSAATR